jgi:hypothetical protein
MMAISVKICAAFRSAAGAGKSSTAADLAANAPFAHFQKASSESLF